MNYLSSSQWCDPAFMQVLHGENSPRQPLMTLQIKQLHFISSHSLSTSGDLSSDLPVTGCYEHHPPPAAGLLLHGKYSLPASARGAWGCLQGEKN